MLKAMNNSCKETEIMGLLISLKETQMGEEKRKQMEKKSYPKVSTYVTTQSHGDIQCNKKCQKEVLF